MNITTFSLKGFDGIAYKSSLSGGFNVVIFDIEAADIVNCFLFETKGIEFKFEEAANPYFVGNAVEK